MQSPTGDMGDRKPSPKFHFMWTKEHGYYTHVPLSHRTTPLMEIALWFISKVDTTQSHIQLIFGMHKPMLFMGRFLFF